MNLKQALIRAEMVLGRIDLDPACTSELPEARVSARPHQGLDSIMEAGKAVSVWLDPPTHARSGTPYDSLYWDRLMQARAAGVLKQGIFIKHGGLVAERPERPAQFLACYPFPEHPKRYNIPTFRDEPQIIYIPGLLDRSEIFKKAFKDFGDLVEPIRSK